MCKLIIVTNRALCQGDFLERIRLLCRAGVDQIVLREKDLEEWEYEQLAGRVLSICKENGVACVLHHFVYTAIKLHAAGIHLSLQDAMKHGKTLKELPMVGVSTHSLEQAWMAQSCHADYVFYGHVFETECKPGLKPRGIRALKDIVEKTFLPVYAIGGIGPENAGLALETGAQGVCVMSWGMQASEAEVRGLVELCHGRGSFADRESEEN